ncbi:MAG: succinate dehydrogenase hydrophobic membrane anchor subunit [Isosphaerales bacterium]
MTRHLKPVGGFELTAWFFMRISGLLLVFLALGHLFITHILNNVETVNYAFVANRWGDPKTGVFWRLWDLTMINLAVLHGGNGLRQVLDEYVIRPGKRVLTHTLIWVGAIFLMMIGTYAIMMFQKDQDYINQKYFKASLGQMVKAEGRSAPGPENPARAVRAAAAWAP